MDEFIKTFSQNLNLCTNEMEIILHQRRLEMKEHTFYCIVNRYFEYFSLHQGIGELEKGGGKYGCDFVDYKNSNTSNEDEYFHLMNKPCTYFNAEYNVYVRPMSYSLYQLFCDEIFTRVSTITAIKNI